MEDDAVQRRLEHVCAIRDAKGDWVGPLYDSVRVFQTNEQELIRDFIKKGETANVKKFRAFYSDNISDAMKLVKDDISRAGETIEGLRGFVAAADRVRTLLIIESATSLLDYMWGLRTGEG